MIHRTRALRAFAAAGAAAVALAAGAASAATVTLNATLDLSLADVAANSVTAGVYFSNTAALPLSPVFSVAEGDTFEFNLDFAGNQQLTVNNLSFLFPLVITENFDEPDAIGMTGTMQLLDGDGNVVAQATRTNYDGSIHIGQVWNGSHFGGSVLTFAGFHYSGVVDDFVNFTVHNYDGPSFYVLGDSVTIGAFAVGVPEPATWALMIGGFAAAGAVLRRRSAAIA